MKQHTIFNKKPLLVFNQWQNAGYAIFSSLKQLIKIGALSVVYLLYANANSATAQTPDSILIMQGGELESIDILEDEMPDVHSGISKVVINLTRSDVERAPVGSVDALLENVAGVDIRSRGSNGMQADVSVRGGSFDQVLVLLNGMNVSDPQTGHNNLNLPIDLSSVSRIEILKGPGAWKYGPGAFSGAINFITPNGSSNASEINLSAGSFKYFSTYVTSGFDLGTSKHFISLNYKRGDGHTLNTDFENHNVYYQGRVALPAGYVQLQGGLSDKAFGANSFYSAKYPNQYEELQSYFLSAAALLKFKKLKLEPSGYYRRGNDRFLLFRNNPALYSNYHTSSVVGLNFTGVYNLSSAFINFGGIVRNESIYSNNLGLETQYPKYSPVNDTVLLHLSDSRTNYSLFVSYKQYLNNLQYSVSVNMLANSLHRHTLFLLPGVDLTYRLHGKHAVYATLNQSMRMPTFTDLYYHGPNNEGNNLLLPEQSKGIEIGYKYPGVLVQMNTAAFFSRGYNMIDWVRESVNDKWRTVNFTELDTRGFEMNLNFDAGKVDGLNRFLHKVALNYTYLNSQKQPAHLQSNYALNYLKNRVDVNVDTKIVKNLYASWHVAYQDRAGQYEKFVDGKSYGMVEYTPFILANAKIMWQKQSWNVYTIIENIFNTQYYDIGNIVQPGLWCKIGVRKKINHNKERN